MRKKLNIREYIVVILSVLVIIGIQLFILKRTGIPEIIIGINGIIFTMFILFYSTKKIYNILIVFYFLPLLLLNNSIHYSFKIEIVFALPLILLLFYTIIASVLNGKEKKTTAYLSKPILIFLSYFLFSAVVGLFYGNNKGFILIESFHFLLFGSIILFRFNITSREDYYYIFKSLLIISIIISFEYIFLGAIISGNRFVTFQSGFLPLISGILFSYFLLAEDIMKKIASSILIAIVILAMVSTLTRSLWVTTIITISTTYVVYLWATNKLTTFKKVLIIILVVVSFTVIIKTISSTQARKSLGRSEKVEDRAESIANPTEDHSFLMRLEMGWYALQKFSEKPILGWGLGDILRYQFLGNNRLLNSYLDNSWLYFLWKGGIIGLSLALFIFYRSIKAGLKVIKQTDNKNVKILVIGFIAGLVGIMALGLLSPLIIKYRTNVLFPLIWGYFEFEYNKLTSTKEQINL